MVSTTGPKPMALVGERPLLWHVMRYYAHFGHTDFVLCLGYGASAVKDFFLNYDETRSNDFVLERGAHDLKLFKTDISDWRITFVDTGLNSPIGERMRRVRHLLSDEPMFMANYADVLTDAPLPDMIERFTASDAAASLLAVPPQSSHHAVDIADDGLIVGVTPMRDLRHWENGGYFIFRPEIFDQLNEDEDLVEDALVRLVRRGRVMAYPYKGYWSPADTVKETDAARRAIPPCRLPVDDLGSGAIRPARARASRVPTVRTKLLRLGALDRRQRQRQRQRSADRGRAYRCRSRAARGAAPVGIGMGAHPDDIEIGAGGTLLTLAEGRPGLRAPVCRAHRDRRTPRRGRRPPPPPFSQRPT